MIVSTQNELVFEPEFLLFIAENMPNYFIDLV